MDEKELSEFLVELMNISINTRMNGGKCEKLDELIEKHKHLVNYDLI